MKRYDSVNNTVDYPCVPCPNRGYIAAFRVSGAGTFLKVEGNAAGIAGGIALQSEFFALEGLSQLLLTVKEVRKTANEDLRVEGIALTMFDGRNNLSKQVEVDARSNLGELVFKTVIPRNVRVSEAPSYSMPVLTYDPSSKGSKAYMNLAQELLANNS